MKQNHIHRTYFMIYDYRYNEHLLLTRNHHIPSNHAELNCTPCIKIYIETSYTGEMLTSNVVLFFFYFSRMKLYTFCHDKSVCIPTSYSNPFLLRYAVPLCGVLSLHCTHTGPAQEILLILTFIEGLGGRNTLSCGK